MPRLLALVLLAFTFAGCVGSRPPTAWERLTPPGNVPCGACGSTRSITLGESIPLLGGGDYANPGKLLGHFSVIDIGRADPDPSSEAYYIEILVDFEPFIAPDPRDRPLVPDSLGRTFGWNAVDETGHAYLPLDLSERLRPAFSHGDTRDESYQFKVFRTSTHLWIAIAIGATGYDLSLAVF